MATKRRRIKTINPVPLFADGVRIKHPTYGVGVIKAHDADNYDFFYYAEFTGKGGDGTKVWLSKVKAEKVCEVV